MKKILMPVRASEELPPLKKKVSGEINKCPTFMIRIDDTFIGTGLQEPEIRLIAEIVDDLIWYKEVSEEEYKKQLLRKFLYWQDNTNLTDCYYSTESMLDKYLKSEQ